MSLLRKKTLYSRVYLPSHCELTESCWYFYILDFKTPDLNSVNVQVVPELPILCNSFGCVYFGGSFTGMGIPSISG